MRARFRVLGIVAAAAAAAWLEAALAGEDPTPEQVADMVDDLRDRDEHVRALARKGLIALGERAVAPLVALLTRGSETERIEAVEMLAAIGPAARNAVPAIVERVRLTSGPARLPLLRALAEIDPAGSAQTAVPIVLAFLENSESAVRLDAARTLRVFGPAAVGHVSDVLERFPRVERSLRGALLEAVRAMVGDAAGHVVDVHSRDRASNSAPWLESVVVELGEAVVPSAVQRLESENHAVRVAAADVLGLAGTAARDAVPALVKALEDPERIVRRRAADALRAVADDPNVVLAPLVRLLEDSSARAQEEAALALAAVSVRAAGTEPELAPPPAAATRAIASALDWLARHRTGDEVAPWRAEKYIARCKPGAACTGQGEPAYDLGVSGLATLAFLGAGQTHERGPYRDDVLHALQQICSSQDAQGVFGWILTKRWIYQHAICTLATTEAWRLTRSKFLEEPALRGLDVLRRAQNPYLAWRYDLPPSGDNDTSVTVWAVRALAAGRRAGIALGRSTFGWARSWTSKMTDPETGRTGYQRRGGPSERAVAMRSGFPADRSEAMTAAGLCVRAEWVNDLDRDPLARQSISLLTATPPRRDDPGSVDFYYWFLGTDALRRVRGAAWENWRDALVGTLLGMQETGAGRCARGSWAPADPWGPDGGRVYSTALAALSLEMSGGVGRKIAMSAEVRGAVTALTRAASSEDASVRAAAESGLAEIRAVYK